MVAKRTASHAPEQATQRDMRAIRQALGISPAQMARLFGVSARTIERWESEGRLPANRLLRAQLDKLQEIVDLGLIVYTPEGFKLFMSTPLGEFDRVTGLELLERGRPDDVLAALAGDYEGIGF